MTDMTSKEIHEVIDRAMKTIAARFDRRFSEGSAPPNPSWPKSRARSTERPSR